MDFEKRFEVGERLVMLLSSQIILDNKGVLITDISHTNKRRIALFDAIHVVGTQYIFSGLMNTMGIERSFK